MINLGKIKQLGAKIATSSLSASYLSPVLQDFRAFRRAYDILEDGRDDGGSSISYLIS